MLVAQSSRLRLRHIEMDDAEFIMGLLNDPDFLKFVGDKNARDLDSTQDYIQQGPVASYENFGFGLYLVELIDGAEPIGICGLLKRTFIEYVELGFALMPGYRGHGYAFEAAQATIEYARNTLDLPQIVAISASDNLRSIKLLERLGMQFDKMMALPVTEKEVKLLKLGL
jgi:ribosomal-protein-alanine N-acetyltransferase